MTEASGRCHVRLGEIVADKQQGAIQVPRERVGKAVAIVETGGVATFSPSAIGLRSFVRQALSDRLHLNLKQMDEAVDISIDILACSDDEGFRQCCRRNDDASFGYEPFAASRRVNFAQQYRHQRRRVDDDHFGNPSSS